MILFVSGRCDIPAFYSEWFFNRMKEGFVDVRNPFNPHQISRIPLHPHHIDAMIFCTKNPIPMLHRLAEIQHIPYQFHITMTPYHKDIEPHVPSKAKIIDAIRSLSTAIGKDKVILRYDPILLNDVYTIAYHKRAFEKMLKLCGSYVDRCIISFVDSYKNTRANHSVLKLKDIQIEDMKALGKAFGEIAEAYHLPIQTCAEDVDLVMYGITQEACVTKEVMEQLLQRPYIPSHHKSPRTCRCLPFVDIGDYNCCAHLCKYCYANYDEAQVLKRVQCHNPKSSVLLGELQEEDQITWRREAENRPISLF